MASKSSSKLCAESLTDACAGGCGNMHASSSTEVGIAKREQEGKKTLTICAFHNRENSPCRSGGACSYLHVKCKPSLIVAAPRRTPSRPSSAKGSWRKRSAKSEPGALDEEKKDTHSAKRGSGGQPRILRILSQLRGKACAQSKVTMHLTSLAAVVGGEKSAEAERSSAVEKELEKRVTELSAWMDSQLASFGEGGVSEGATAHGSDSGDD